MYGVKGQCAKGSKALSRMTQLPARKIAACFNNICFWREREPLQWAAFAHVQSGHTDVTTLLREVHAAEEGLEARAGAQQVKKRINLQEHQCSATVFIRGRCLGVSPPSSAGHQLRKTSLLPTFRRRGSGQGDAEEIAMDFGSDENIGGRIGAG